MAYIAINGVQLPYPKRGVTPTVTTVVDSGRNLNAVVVGQRIGRDQYKIDSLEWPWLSSKDWARILQLCSNFFIYCTFWDMVNDQQRTLKMYVGDRTAIPYFVDENGKPTYYRDCKVNIIDTGLTTSYTPKPTPLKPDYDIGDDIYY